MSNKPYRLLVLSQEKQLVDVEVESATVPTTTGQVTILADHIPLLSSLAGGELTYKTNQGQESIVISKGFLDMDDQNKLTIMVDTAVHERDISLEKAQQAMIAAKETMATSQDQHELILAEASLKQAMWEIQVAQKTRKAKI